MDADKILIIDDEADIRYTLQEICLVGGWEPVLAINGQEGYTLFKIHNPKLVIVDYHMPGWDGLTTVKKIRGCDSATSIMVLTVDERQEIADRFLAAGATDFAIKPIKAPDLISRIKVNLEISEMQRQNQGNLYLDKGISLATLRVITKFLQKHPEPLTIEEITAGVNLAYQTVHRYLGYLVDYGKVEVTPHYGKVGRPKNKYRLIEQVGR